MKKFISTVLVSLLSAAAMCGVIGIDSQQNGVATFSESSGLVTNISLPIPFSQRPIIAIYPSATNNGPFSVTLVTTTNFTLTATTASTTNASVYWVASAGFARIQSGTNTVTAGTPLLLTYPVPYAFLPTVSVTSPSTNVNAIIGVTGVTRTNCTITSTTSGQFQWSSFGTSFAPGANAVTY